MLDVTFVIDMRKDKKLHQVLKHRNLSIRSIERVTKIKKSEVEKYMWMIKKYDIGQKVSDS